MNNSQLLKRNDVLKIIQRNSLKNYEIRQETYYLDLKESEISLNLLQKINESYQKDIKNQLSKDKYILLSTKDPTDNSLLIQPARGIDCKHSECLNLPNLVNSVSINK